MSHSARPISRRHASGMTLHKTPVSYVDLVDFGMVLADELVSGWEATRFADAKPEADDNASLLTDILDEVSRGLYGILDLQECYLKMDNNKNICAVFVNSKTVAKTVQNSTKKKEIMHSIKTKAVREADLETMAISSWSAVPLPKKDLFWGLFEDNLKSEIIKTFKPRIENIIRKARHIPAPIVAA